MKNITKALNIQKQIAAGICIVLLFSAASCKKKQEDTKDYGARFIGSRGYSGPCTGGLYPYVSFVQGTSTNAIIIKGMSISQSNCNKYIEVNAVATENTLTIPSQAFVDDCGVSVLVSGYASLENNMITLSWTVVKGTITQNCLYFADK